MLRSCTCTRCSTALICVALVVAGCTSKGKSADKSGDSPPILPSEKKPAPVQETEFTSCDHSNFRSYAWDDCHRAITQRVLPKEVGSQLLKTQVADTTFQTPKWVAANGDKSRDLAKVRLVREKANRWKVFVRISAQVYSAAGALRFTRLYECTFGHKCSRAKSAQPLDLLGTAVVQK